MAAGSSWWRLTMSRAFSRSYSSTPESALNILSRSDRTEALSSASASCPWSSLFSLARASPLAFRPAIFCASSFSSSFRLRLSRSFALSEACSSCSCRVWSVTNFLSRCFSKLSPWNRLFCSICTRSFSVAFSPRKSSIMTCRFSTWSEARFRVSILRANSLSFFWLSSRRVLYSSHCWSACFWMSFSARNDTPKCSKWDCSKAILAFFSLSSLRSSSIS
mmetsp:Transcript_48340/g.94832  ORF Transcript_48340/g.94832 Transcript_48340/m.94832 type:complete len:220 (+) Transcript_48340:1166-1825(+)